MREMLSEIRAGNVEALNRTHHIVRRDDEALTRAIMSNRDLLPLQAQLSQMFAKEAVFVSAADFDAMTRLIEAVETLAQRPGYQAEVQSGYHLDKLPASSAPFMGFDFHLTTDGPRLIEINTNAGGAFLNAFAAQALTACCDEMRFLLDGSPLPDFETFVPAMITREWRQAGREGKPQTIAIVDDAPQSQFLYPEFLLAQTHFARAGMTAFIADPADLYYTQEGVFFGGQKVDLVYNRLTDFQLSEPTHRELAQAWARDQIVLTPSPLHHDLYANKRNLTLLSDPARLRAIGANEAEISALSLIPSTVELTVQTEDWLWAERKSHFFKPLDGYGSKAVWRGDKLTRKNWEYMKQGRYVAQRFACPSSKQVLMGDSEVEQKVDLRLYAYAGEVFLAAARLYQGQTTNFRTPGGGFAPVAIV